MCLEVVCYGGCYGHTPLYYADLLDILVLQVQQFAYYWFKEPQHFVGSPATMTLLCVCGGGGLPEPYYFCKE